MKENIRSFFVYGTLQKACNKNYQWKDMFHEGATKTPKTAIVRSYQLCYDHYPAMFPSNDHKDYVIGEIVTFDKRRMKHKIQHLDWVEGVPEFYRGEIVHAVIVDDDGVETGEIVHCYTYVRDRDKLNANASSIDGGCWITYSTKQKSQINANHQII